LIEKGPSRLYHHYKAFGLRDMVAEEYVAEELKHKLKEVFGYSHFRGIQESIIQNILAQRNTFVIMPTGAGKSLCYQLPAVMQPGTAVVISPLIALMKNQVDQMNAVGVSAEFLNSTLNKAEMTRVKKSVLMGETKLLYVAPESLTKEENVAFLRKANISFVAIDEAHCISEWGHDFRPEYRRIRSIVEMLGELPLMALTATATPKVQQDIQKNLSMEDASLFKTSFNRHNLFYEVQPKRDTRKQLMRFIQQRKGESGIIYCLSRKKVEEIAEFLKVNDVKALPYHAGLEANTRMRNQDAFLNEEVDVVVATIAFGMGIDKPDVRFVIHYDAPKSLEGYYQETGRAGRDGMEGHCLMFYAEADIAKLEKFNKDKPVTERDNARHLLAEMTDYAESGVCRRRQLLHYFGEVLEKDCGFCDNCSKPTEMTRLEKEPLIAIKAVRAMEDRFGARHVCDVITGVRNEYVESYEHYKLPIFGAGAAHSGDYWYSLIRQLTINGFIERDTDNQIVIRLTAKGLAFMDKPTGVSIAADHDFSNTEAEDEEAANLEAAARTRSYDEGLFNQLKLLVKKVAKEKNLPPYVIFQEPSLAEMATVYPCTEAELSKIVGVGVGKVKKFGAPFLAAIKKYVEDNDIETAADVVIKSNANKSKQKIDIIAQIDRKIALEEICERTRMNMPTLLTEIENICFAGTKLNLDYYLDTILESDRQGEIEDYFLASESDSLPVAMHQLGDEFSEEEIRLMRLKFFNEHAN
jgi:ATP-dependent DNA helicase RecQ